MVGGGQDRGGPLVVVGDVERHRERAAGGRVGDELVERVRADRRTRRSCR